MSGQPLIPPPPRRNNLVPPGQTAPTPTQQPEPEPEPQTIQEQILNAILGEDEKSQDEIGEEERDEIEEEGEGEEEEEEEEEEVEEEEEEEGMPDNFSPYLSSTFPKSGYQTYDGIKFVFSHGNYYHYKSPNKNRPLNNGQEIILGGKKYRVKNPMLSNKNDVNSELDRDSAKHPTGSSVCGLCELSQIKNDPIV
jgi:hypothetical protein